ERIGLDHELPAQPVGSFDIFHGGVMRHVDGLADGSRDKRLGGGEHANVGLGRQAAPAVFAAFVGAVKHRVMLRAQMRSSLDGHSAADIGIGLGDLLAGKAERSQKVESRHFDLLRLQMKLGFAEVVANRPAVESKGQLKSAWELALDSRQNLVREAL